MTANYSIIICQVHTSNSIYTFLFTSSQQFIYMFTNDVSITKKLQSDSLKRSDWSWIIKNLFGQHIGGV